MGRPAKAWLGLLAFAAAFGANVRGTQDANANGDTRTLTFYNQRTQESGSFTFRRNGSYDQDVLKQLSWLMRDWRLDEPTRMEPKLFDIVWQVYREVGGSEPIEILSAYRAPQTNAMLRRRSRQVSEHSQHMSGRALDFRIPGVSMARVREVGMRLQEGGVGFYPGPQFVHLDAGSVRSWPRMPGYELARLFPDGRTVHIPRDGKPLAGYEEAKQMIIAKGGSVAGYATYAEAEETGPRKSLWATLFGGGNDDEDSEYYRSAASRTRVASRGTQVAAYAGSSSGEDAGSRGFFAAATNAPAPAETAAPTRGRAGRSQVAAVAPAAVAPAPVPTAPAPGFEATAAAAPAAAADLATAPEPLRAPMPPRRPEDIAVLIASAPLPPMRPASAPSLGGGAAVLGAELRGQMDLPERRQAQTQAAEERAALKSLFEAAATSAARRPSAAVSTSRTKTQPLLLAAAAIVHDPGSNVRMSFSSTASDEPSPDAFSGPAVTPLPILR